MPGKRSVKEYFGQKPKNCEKQNRTMDLQQFMAMGNLNNSS
jgi:hypothetical protein